MEDLKQTILNLEKELMKSEVRKSAERISNLMADDYMEFCSSGFEYHYKNGDVFQDKDDHTEFNWEILDFHMKLLSKEYILATYKVIKHNGADEDKKYSLRSSIWKLIEGKWKIIFHQGTCASKF